jgi:hypothetical protein
MAFNPFVSFRKYQKFWMATILLVCMVTFVLCTGVGGDLSDRLLRIFGGRHGKVYVKLNDRNLYYDDFEKLKIQRHMINDFMQESIKLVLNRIDALKKEDDGKGDVRRRKALLTRLQAVEMDLKIRKARKHYFETGTTLNDLVDFMIWKKLADKLGVELVDETIKYMFDREVFNVVPLGRDQQPVGLFGGLDSRHIQYELRHKYQNINDQAVIRALRDEYKVRIAQLAYLQAQTGTYRRRVDRFFDVSMEELRFLKFRSPDFFYEQTRISLTPAQMWDMYKEKRTQYDVALVPVRVDKFLNEIKQPNPDDLAAFFKKYQKVSYDPASPTPGFEIPAKVKVEWVMADPESAMYKESARAVSLLEMTPPLTWSPFFPHLAAAVSSGGNPLAWNASMERNYAFEKKSPHGEKYLMAPLSEPALPSLLSYLGKPTPELAASMVGLGAGPDPGSAIQASMIGHLYPKHQKQIEELLAAENKPRARLMANLVGLGYGTPLAAVRAWDLATRAEQYLPLAAVAKELKEQHERTQAGAWVITNMNAVKEKLDELQSGKERAFRQTLDPLIREYGLRHQMTNKFYDRFTIPKSPELAELYKAFENYRHMVNQAEGRQDATRLKEGDFYRLFFTGESFAAGSRFIAKPWPPVVEVRGDQPNAPSKIISLFDKVEKPFLFWKIEERQSQPPENLEQVKDQVITAWKMEKAKEKYALARAKEIAQELEKSGGNLLPILNAEAKKLGGEPIILEKVSVLYPVEDKTRIYRDYPLPKDKFNNAYPREDMVKQLLTLTTMEKPVNIEYKALDDPNKKLFDSFKKHPEGKKIQILTNLPQNTFYVAAVVVSPGPDMADFARAYRRATGGFLEPLDGLIDTFQIDFGREFRQNFMDAQKEAMKYSKDFSEDERKSFDAQ